MAVTVLTIRKFKSKLPYDFEQLVSVQTTPRTATFIKVDNNRAVGRIKREVCDTFMCIPTKTEMMYRSLSSKPQPNLFCISGDEIHFMGSYSNNIIVRCIQLLSERIAPKKVILNYINIK